MKTQKKQGFTIIEVVLVLAIAGLIFLLVFIALPALQRNQKDDERKREVSRVAQQINTYVSNNKGQLPTMNDTFAGYLDATNADGVFTLKSGYTVQLATPDDGKQDTTIQVKMSTKCADDNTFTTGNSRQAAARIALENGTNKNTSPATYQYFCQNN